MWYAGFFALAILHLPSWHNYSLILQHCVLYSNA